MNYYEIKFQYNSSIENEIINDILAGELGETGFESFTSDTEGLTAYIKENVYDKKAWDTQLELFPLPGVGISYKETLIEGKDWNEEWEKNYFQPITIGNQCVIHASFHHIPDPYEFDIIIDPKMAFGAGNHETTRLVIQEILARDLSGKKVLDMGCGTAVLAILSAMKKAASVVAIDIDEWAYRNATENIRLNHTPVVKVLHGGVEQIPGNITFDLVLANINRNILLNDIHRYAQAMHNGSALIMSGFYIEDVPVISEECVRHGLTVISRRSENNWTCVVVRK